MNKHEINHILGPLAPLYEDPAVREIMVDAPDNVYIEREGKLEDVSITFESNHTIRAMIDALFRLTGTTLSLENPVGEMRLPDDSRLTAVVPPTALNGPTMVIRKMNPSRLTWENLIEYGAITEQARAFLRDAIHARVNTLLAGGANAGKTTIINMLAECIPAELRIVVVEQSHEMQIEHKRCVWLEAGGPSEQSMGDLLKTAENLRPDWLIVGELRGAEALYALQAMSVGLTGMTTIHATSAEDALARLESFCLMANLGLGLGEIRRLIASAIQLVSYQRQMPTGNRKIVQLVELCGLTEDHHYHLRPLFRYNPDIDLLEATETTPSWAS